MALTTTGPKIIGCVPEHVSRSILALWWRFLRHKRLDGWSSPQARLGSGGV